MTTKRVNKSKKEDIFERKIDIEELIKNDPAIEFSVDSLWEIWKGEERPKMSKIEFAQKHRELIFLHAYTMKSITLGSFIAEMEQMTGISFENKISPNAKNNKEIPKPRIIVPGNNKIH